METVRELKVGDKTYRLSLLPATAGSEVLSKLLGMIGDPAGRFFAQIGSAPPGDNPNNPLETKVPPDLAGTVLGMLGKEIAKPGTVDMIKVMLESLEVKNEKGGWVRVHYDMEFAGRYDVLSKLISMGIDLNFRSFFLGNDALQELLAKAK